MSAEGSIVQARRVGDAEGKAFPARSVIARDARPVLVRETTDAEVAAIRERASAR